MASTYSDLKFELIGTGEQSGTWGTTTNTNIGTAIQEAITGSGDVTFASGAVALTLTNSNAAQTARNLRLNLTGTSGGAQNLTVPDIEKFYLVNNGCADAITVKNSTGATVAVPAGKAMLLFSTGSAIVDAVSHMSSVTLATALAVSSGGTGSTTAGGARTNLGLGALAVLAQVDTGQIVDDAVTTAKILDANVTAGKIATDAVTTVKILDANVTDAKIATMSSSKLSGALPAISGTALIGIAVLDNYSTFVNSTELVTVSATAATGTINYDTNTQSVVYYTAAAVGDWTVNFRASSGDSLNSVLTTGEAITLVHLVTLTGAEYRNTVVQVDGVGITPKWQGGAAPTEGNINSIDSYTYTLIKTGDAAFTILAALTQYA